MTTSYRFVRRGPSSNGSALLQKRREALLQWRAQHPEASIQETAARYGLSVSGVRNLLRRGTR